MSEPTIPTRDATVTVNYWTLDCLLDWVQHHLDEERWDAEAHYDELRAALAAADAVRAVVMIRADADVLLSAFAQTVRDHHQSVLDHMTPGAKPDADHKRLTAQYLKQRRILIDALTNQPAALTSDGATGLSERLNPIATALVEYIIEAVARAACPPNCVVVRTDDLRAVLDHGIIGWQSGVVNPHEAYDRLRAKVGDE